MRINHNIGAINAQRNMNINASSASKSMEKLSSGLRINRAGDDAAGLAISEKMRGQIRGLDQAATNAQDGISMIQTAEGALNETHSILQRMRELSVQGENGTYTSQDKAAIDAELSQLSEEIDRIASTTEFNQQKLLNASSTIKLQIGANANQTMSIQMGKMTASKLGVKSIKAGKGQIDAIDTAINAVSTQRSSFGAVQNRLEHTINNLTTASENLTAAESRIRDTDMAKEMSEYSKNNILQQASQAMLAQAKAGPQSVLSLLN